MNIRITVVLLLWFNFFTCSCLQASVGLMPTLERGVSRSRIVAVGEFVGFTPEFQKILDQGKTDYFTPVTTRFSVIKLLKGAVTAKELTVSLGTYSACEAPKNWKFHREAFPNPGTRWILLLEEEYNDAWPVYAGFFGLIPFTDEKLGEVEEALKQVPSTPDAQPGEKASQTSSTDWKHVPQSGL
ncbi:MAG: hypothetical protein HQM09_16290 [Candidatus Riflebacteria bacterium]|nr:hypothetical protein [Candidatus Riflebacteria bacterium]